MRLHFFNSAVIANSKTDYWLTDEERLHLWFQASEKEERKTTNDKLLGKDPRHAGKFPNLETCEIQWQKNVNGK